MCHQTLLSDSKLLQSHPWVGHNQSRGNWAYILGVEVVGGGVVACNLVISV